MEHRLKTWPLFFADVSTGAKTFDIRKDDRNFQVGDTLLFLEFDPEHYVKKYTGREIRVIVNYIVSLDDIPGMQKGFVGMSIELVD
jgi:hypothetical protein